MPKTQHIFSNAVKTHLRKSWTEPYLAKEERQLQGFTAKTWQNNEFTLQSSMLVCNFCSKEPRNTAYVCSLKYNAIFLANTPQIQSKVSYLWIEKVSYLQQRAKTWALATSSQQKRAWKTETITLPNTPENYRFFDGGCRSVTAIVYIQTLIHIPTRYLARWGRR